MRALGLMTPAGEAVIRRAEADGSWSALDASEALVMPPDLKRALAKSPAARKTFTSFPRSTPKYTYEWIYQAKRPETRARRVAETVAAAAEGRRVRG